MYGLDARIDLSFLRGRELQQVAVGLYQVQFHFDEDLAICIEGEFRYSDGDREVLWRQEPNSSSAAASTVALLGAAIRGFTASQDGTLRLEFSNGHRLTIFDSSKDYESYSITRPGLYLCV